MVLLGGWVFDRSELGVVGEFLLPLDHLRVGQAVCPDHVQGQRCYLRYDSRFFCLFLFSNCMFDLVRQVFRLRSEFRVWGDKI